MLPPDHPQRRILNDEVHARPSEPITAPTRISYLVLFSGGAPGDSEWVALEDLAKRYEAVAPRHKATHYSGNFGPFRLRCERHTEFSRILLLRDGGGKDPFADPVFGQLRRDWLESMPGEVLYAGNIAVMDSDFDLSDIDELSARHFAGNILIGSRVGGGAGVALTDFKVHGDGFSRMLLRNDSMRPRQCGRVVQRLLEIETYRMMALLALPMARQLVGELSEREGELAKLTSIMAQEESRDEQSLLDRLTRLQAAIESRYADSHYRFSAAAAYHALVERRIGELREERMPGVQNFREFTGRRLDPAINTCQSVKARQESLAVHVARATQLLSTRVDIARHGQNQAVLASMNRRVKLQLRLQRTVEGLSVVAITYYLVGLVDYAAGSLKEFGIGVSPDLIVGISVPVVAFVVWRGLRRIQHFITQRSGE